MCCANKNRAIKTCKGTRLQALLDVAEFLKTGVRVLLLLKCSLC